VRPYSNIHCERCGPVPLIRDSSKLGAKLKASTARCTPVILSFFDAPFPRQPLIRRAEAVFILLYVKKTVLCEGTKYLKYPFPIHYSAAIENTKPLTTIMMATVANPKVSTGTLSSQQLQPQPPRSSGRTEGDVGTGTTTTKEQQPQPQPPSKNTKKTHKKKVKPIVTPTRPKVDKAVVDELLLVCSVIGSYDETTQTFVPVTDCLQWLQDLQRALRRDDDVTRAICLLLGDWKVVEQKLLPLVAATKYDTQLVLTVCKILVLLTKPLSIATQRAAVMPIATKSSKQTNPM
jgi:hypothetical protein